MTDRSGNCYPETSNKPLLYQLVDRLVIRCDDPREPEGWLKLRAVLFGIWPGVFVLGLTATGLLEGGLAVEVYLPIAFALVHSWLVARVINDRIRWLNAVDPTPEDEVRRRCVEPGTEQDGDDR